MMSCSCCLAGCWVVAAAAAAAGASELLSVLYPAHAWRQHPPTHSVVGRSKTATASHQLNQPLTCSRASAPDRYSSMDSSQTHSPSCGQAVLGQAGSHFCFCCKADVAKGGTTQKNKPRHPSKVSLRISMDMVVFVDETSAFPAKPSRKPPAFKHTQLSKPQRTVLPFSIQAGHPTTPVLQAYKEADGCAAGSAQSWPAGVCAAGDMYAAEVADVPVCVAGSVGGIWWYLQTSSWLCAKRDGSMRCVSPVSCELLAQQTQYTTHRHTKSGQTEQHGTTQHQQPVQPGTRQQTAQLSFGSCSCPCHVRGWETCCGCGPCPHPGHVARAPPCAGSCWGCGAPHTCPPCPPCPCHHPCHPCRRHDHRLRHAAGCPPSHGCTTCSSSSSTQDTERPKTSTSHVFDCSQGVGTHARPPPTHTPHILR